MHRMASVGQNQCTYPNSNYNGENVASSVSTPNTSPTRVFPLCDEEMSGNLIDLAVLPILIPAY